MSVYFYVNGIRYDVPDTVDPTDSLLGFLRERGITSPKRGCGVGVCGACTVMQSISATQHRVINACLAPLASVHMTHIVTTEGLPKDHPIIERFAAAHATQCGMCTPGFVISLYTALRNNPESTEEQLVGSFAGNLCRCTGYRPILDVARSFSSSCCGNKDAGGCCTGLTGDQLSPPDVTAAPVYGEPIYPAALIGVEPAPLQVKGPRCTWYSPVTLEGLKSLISAHPEARLIGGNTSIATRRGTEFISVARIPEMQNIELADDTLTIGAGVSFGQLLSFLEEKQAPPLSALGALKSLLSHFGSPQIRNVSLIGACCALDEGNSDWTAYLLGVDASISREDQLVTNVRIYNVVSPSVYVWSEKFNRKENNSRSDFGATFRVQLDGDSKVSDMGSGVCGVGEHAQAVTSLNLELMGQPWDYNILAKGFLSLKSVSSESALEALFFRFFSTVRSAVRKEEPEFSSVAQFKASRGFQGIPEPLKELFPLTHANRHNTGLIQANGTAKFLDDERRPSETLHLALATSRHARAEILSIDASAALQMPGVVDVLLSGDLPAPGDAILASDTVHFHGHPLACVVATDNESALRAAHAVKVEYKVLEPVLTIEQADKAGKLQPAGPFATEWEHGDVEAAFARDDVVIMEGDLETPASEHWYLETHTAVATPGEDGEMHVSATAQSLKDVRENVAKALGGVPAHLVKVSLKRLGGGFGGKGGVGAELAAVAAAKHQVPCSIVLPRSTDLSITSKRGRFTGHYKVAATKQGKLVACQWSLKADGGWRRAPFAAALLQEAMSFLDNCYNIENFKTIGVGLQTNKCPIGALRGAGIPQGIAMAELMIERLALKLNMEPEALREVNLLKSGSSVHVEGLQALSENDVSCLDRTWKAGCQDLPALRSQVDAFNKDNAFCKQAVAVVPVRYGVGATAFRGSHHGYCTIHCYSDGTVLVHHGGIEMGQGVDARIINLVAHHLRVQPECVRVARKDTSVIANAGTSGGSYTFEANSKPAMQAAILLRKTLDQVQAEHFFQESTCDEEQQEVTFGALVKKALHERLSMTQTCYARTEHSKQAVDAHGFQYFTWGSALAHVEVDLLTGSHRVLRADLCQEIGRSLDPALDVGQIEGGFMQGVSWLTVEDLRWDPSGRLLNSAEQVPIAGVSAVPRLFNVRILDDTVNADDRSAHGHKGIGEPPYCLSTAVACAIRRAVLLGRSRISLDCDVDISPPFTAPAIRSAAGDQLKEFRGKN